MENIQIREWLERVPKPIGIMTCNDLMGKHILDSCIQSKIKVPEEVAIIGVDNDPLFTNISNPTMSSVIQ